MEETLGHPTCIGQGQTTHDDTFARTFSSTVLSIFSDGVSSTYFSSLSYSLFRLDKKVSSLFYLICPHNAPFYPPTTSEDSHFFPFGPHILTINYYLSQTSSFSVGKFTLNS